MKQSLRNIALAGLMVVAGAAMAQNSDGSPLKVTKLWNKDITGFVNTNCRFGAAYDGKVYFNDKSVGKVYAVDASGVSEYATTGGASPAIGADEAGNLLVGVAWPGSPAAGTQFKIVNAQTQEVTDCDIAVPDGITATGIRVDQIGRIAGNMLSDEGAIVYLCQNGATAVQMVYIQNGHQADGDFTYFDSATGCPATINTSAVCQPKYDFAKLMSMVNAEDELCANSDGFYIRNRSLQTVYSYVGEDWADMTKPAGSISSEGFDVFEMDGHSYQVQPVKETVNYSSVFVIADEAGQIVFKSQLPDQSNGSQSFGSYMALKQADGSYILYQYFAGAGAKMFAAAWKIESANAAPAAEPLYLCGSMQGWDPTNATELAYANGKYTFSVTDATAEFKLSRNKGPWDGDGSFNAGVIGVDDVAYTLQPGVPATLTAGKTGNICAPGKGTWNFEIDLTAMTIVCNGSFSPIAAPEAYLRGTLNNWGNDGSYPADYAAWRFEDKGLDPSNPNCELLELCLAEGIAADAAFKICGPESNWSGLNLGSNQQLALDQDITLDQGGADIKPAQAISGPVYLVLKYTTSGSTLRAQGTSAVNSIEAAPADQAAEYFNLQGVRVANPTAGNLYIVRQAGKVSKQLVK